MVQSWTVSSYNSLSAFVAYSTFSNYSHTSAPAQSQDTGMTTTHLNKTHRTVALLTETELAVAWLLREQLFEAILQYTESVSTR